MFLARHTATVARRVTRSTHHVAKVHDHASRGGRVCRSAAVAAAAVAAVGTSYAVAAEDQVYESCDAIGDGLRGEFWKARNKNVNVLELEMPGVQKLITKIRDEKTSARQFVFLTDRLVALIIETALGELDASEETITTASGYKFLGSSHDKDIELCGVALSDDGGFMINSLHRLQPDISVGSLTVGKDKKARFSGDAPELDGKTVILLAPTVVSGATLLAGISALTRHGVSAEDIMVISISVTPDAVARITKEAGDVSVITASIESENDGYDVRPGLGDFRVRYRNGLAAQKNAEGTN